MEKGIALERFEYIRSLYRRHLAHALSGREHDELMRFFDTCTEEELQHVVGKLSDETDVAIPVTADQERRANAVFGRIAGVTEPKPRKSLVRRLAPWLAAAVVILVMGVALFFFFASETGTELADIQPGGNHATLTLADGRTIDLSEEQEGIIIQDGITYLDGTQVMKNGELRMENEGPSILNSITTPKGGTYQVTLPDGSKVWLNSASTLKYPSRFTGDSREVILEGEAYFDIRPQVGGVGAQYLPSVSPSGFAPFNVLTAGQVVQVLGTQFNISAYADDAETKTTLVEGKVRVAVSSPDQSGQALEGGRDGLSGGRARPDLSGGVIQELSPGMQAIFRGAHIETTAVDINEYTAWRDGYFHFGESLEQIMEKLARWYDVSVVYADGVDRKQEFGGRIARDKPISAALRIMAMTDKVTFRLEEAANGERRVVVMP